MVSRKLHFLHHTSSRPCQYQGKVKYKRYTFDKNIHCMYNPDYYLLPKSENGACNISLSRREATACSENLASEQPKQKMHVFPIYNMVCKDL